MTGWRLAFFAAALFNFAVGLPMVIAPNLVSGGLGMAAADALTVRLLGWMITTFGIGYAMVGLEPRKHRGIVLLGIIGKGGVAGVARPGGARCRAAGGGRLVLRRGVHRLPASHARLRASGGQA